jgi:regulatory protein
MCLFGQETAYTFQKSAHVFCLCFLSGHGISHHHLPDACIHTQPAVYDPLETQSCLGYMKPGKRKETFHFEVGKEKILQMKLETYCAYAERCSADVVRKLWEWKVPVSMHEDWLAHLREHRFLDDERFAGAFVQGKFRMKGWGNNKIKVELRAKSLQDEIIEKALGQVEEGSYKEKLFSLMEKKDAHLKEENPQQRKAKLFRYGVQKGYEAALVLEWLDRQK